jgi:hypothetical protein
MLSVSIKNAAEEAMRYSAIAVFFSLLTGCSGLLKEEVPEPPQSGVDRAVERAKKVRGAVYCADLYKKGPAAPVADDVAGWVSDGAKLDVGICQAVMGQWAEHGVRGPQSLVAARGWYEKAALDSTEGNVEMARLAEQGIGQPENPQEAFEWRLRAAERKDIRSEMIVAQAYESGSGVAADTDTALQWYRKVAYRTDGHPQTDDAWAALIRLHGNGVIESSGQLKPDEEGWKRIWRRRMSNLMEREMAKHPATGRLNAVLIATYTGTVSRPTVAVAAPSGDAGFDAAMADALAAMPMPPLPVYAVGKPMLEMRSSVLRTEKQEQ